jgi:CDP-paratose 2-epimerase
VHDYARIYGLKTIVFRMGSIYGPHQFGLEDQAWMAYFVIAATKGWPISIYGDGKQVRDVLYIGDLLRAFELALKKIDVTAGEIYNIGGGVKNTISVWIEFAPLLGDLLNKKVQADAFGEWRPGDQKVYFSDIRKSFQDFGWKPGTRVDQGIQQLVEWVINNQDLFEK